MGDNQSFDMDHQIIKIMSGGLLRLVLDDELTIIYATDAFYKLLDIDINKQTRLPKTIVKTVYSTDIINYTHQIVAQKKRKDNQFLLFYRVLLKNGDLRWIMLSGSKDDESYKKNNKELPIYACIAMDITAHMLKHKYLEQQVDYYSTISELSRDLVFEYVIASDTLSFSELFYEIFNKESKIANFSKRLKKTTIMHPEDLPRLIKTYMSVMNGKKQVRLEFRMITKEEKLVWYVCYASVVFDENKNPSKIIGKLSSICPRKEEVGETTTKMKLDTLTQVYTKDTAEGIIGDVLSNQEAHALSAVMLCEVRNYKNINDIVRVVDGENVIKTIANILKRFFRNTDVIGRIGLSEFIVCMRDINSDKNAYKRAEDICKEVSNLYSYSYNKNQITISIGITFVKGSMDYANVLANAKTALVMAKKDINSSFEAFYTANN